LEESGRDVILGIYPAVVGGTECDNGNQDSLSSGVDINLRHPEYGGGMLPTGQGHSLLLFVKWIGIESQSTCQYDCHSIAIHMGPTGCAIDCAVCRRPFITTARFRSQVILDGIRGAESVTRTGLSYRCYFGFPLSLSFHQCSIFKFQSPGTDATWCRKLAVSISKPLLYLLPY